MADFVRDEGASSISPVFSGGIIRGLGAEPYYGNSEQHSIETMVLVAAHYAVAFEIWDDGGQSESGFL